MEGETPEDPALFPARPGERLRAAREAQGLDLAEIAARTRIPLRHLEAIEAGTYAGLPSVTYATGFARAYARSVGADDVTIARDVRAELGTYQHAAPAEDYPLDEPSRVASGGLAWFGVIVAVLIVAGVGIWYGTNLFRGGGSRADETVAQLEPTPTPSSSAAPTPAAPAVERVTLVARGPAWIRVTDAGGNRLVEKEMAAGERYDVPLDADHPRIRTGRPDQLQVLINGSEVAPLGTGVQTVEADISAAALRARGTSTPPPSPSPTATAGATTQTRAVPRGQRRLGPRMPDSVDYSTPAASGAEPATASGANPTP
ncbi:helix-turn-helix domain-containing protein [Sphingomonas sp. RS6]